MSLFYIPIEISKRELIGKTFLGAKLASMGHQVIIFESSLFDSTKWPFPGTYIGKNCFRTERPTSMFFYKKMKSSEVNVFLLEEEGGVFSGSSQEEWQDRLIQRFDLSVLDKSDRIFAWGNWQADVYKSEKPSANVSITGSPSFDVFQRKYANFLHDFDKKQTNNFKDYILINTRFSTSNGLRPLKWFLSDAVPVNNVSGQKLADEIINDGTMQYHMTALVKKLSYDMPEETFVIRPHPAEDTSFYEEIFKFTNNVFIIPDGDASSWIRRCKTLIHFGCTTAIQADIYGTDIITYNPGTLGLYAGPELPNQIGSICKNYQEVYESLLRKHDSLNEPPWKDTIAELDSINIISSICSNLPSTKNISNLASAIRLNFFFYRIKQRIFDLVRIFFRKRYTENKINKKKFDYDFFSCSEEIFYAAKSYYGEQIKLTSNEKDYFIIEKK